MQNNQTLTVTLTDVRATDGSGAATVLILSDACNATCVTSGVNGASYSTGPGGGGTYYVVVDALAGAFAKGALELECL